MKTLSRMHHFGQHAPLPRPWLLGFCLVALGGCQNVTDPYMREGVWRPNNSNGLNFELQVARPADLLARREAMDSDGESAAAAVDRLRKDKIRPLPASSLSPIGSSGGGGS